MSPVPAHKQVAVVFTAALLYGLYISTLLFCFRWLLFADEGWKRRKFVNWPMVAVTASIFLLTAVYLSISLASTMTTVYAFSNPPHNVSQSLPAWYAIVQCTTANLTALLADSVLIYRCWVVYNRTIRAIFFPIILWAGGMVCTALQAYLQIVHTQNPLIGPKQWEHVNMTLGPGIVLIPFWGSTAALNAYCTGMLIYKIYSVAQGSIHMASAGQLRFVIRILVDSGFLYLSVTIAHFVVWFTTNDVAITIVTAFNLPLIGIAFNFILIRTSENRADKTRNLRTIPASPSSLGFSCKPSTTTGSNSFLSTGDTDTYNSQSKVVGNTLGGSDIVRVVPAAIIV